MADGLLVLALVLVIGMVGRNELAAWAAALLLTASLFELSPLLSALEAYSMQAGLTLLFIGILLPFASGRLGWRAAIRSLLSPAGLVTLAIGALAAYLGTLGVTLLRAQPQTLLGLVLGSIAGLLFFDGIPVGPLVAAGLAALILQWVS